MVGECGHEAGSRATGSQVGPPHVHITTQQKRLAHPLTL